MTCVHPIVDVTENRNRCLFCGQVDDSIANDPDMLACPECKHLHYCATIGDFIVCTVPECECPMMPFDDSEE